VPIPRQRPEPARQASLREHNLALVLRELADAGPASRARLAAATGLTKGTVSSLIEVLAAGGLVTDLGTGPASGALGRPGLTVGLDPHGPLGVGLEINVDYLATCTVDLTGAVRHRQLVAQDFRDQDVSVVLARASSAVDQALTQARTTGADVAGVAVAVPGLVETDAEVLRLAPNLGWRDVPVVEELRRRVDLHGLQTRLDNEANLAALGELWCGGQLDVRSASFIHLSGEVGVGAGVVLDGRLYRGRHGFSGEVGHLPVRPSGPTCSCGGQGCLEQVAGQEWILRRAGMPATVSTLTGRPEGSVDELARRARDGDRKALAAIVSAGRSLGLGVAALVNLLDVDTVVLGGLYAVLAPWLRETVEQELAARVLATPWAPVSVLVSSLGGEAAVRGAATSVLRDVLSDPAAYLAHRGS
jgi:predicted NBD/HSP70 family sugar kinase